MLVDRGALSPVALEQALSVQGARRGRLGEVLVRLGAVSEDVLYAALSEQLGIGLVDPSSIDVEAAAAAAKAMPTPAGSVLGRKALVWRDGIADGNSPMDTAWHVATSDPLDPELCEAAHALAGNAALHWHLLQPSELERLQARLKRGVAPNQSLAQSLRELAEDAPVIAFVNNLLAQALEARASDVHIEPGSVDFEIRLRIDGVLHTRMSLPMARFAAIASRVKLIGNLDIAERRLPQDGRISAHVAGTDLDIRISTIPSVWGESLVLRLLPKARGELDLGGVGMLSDHLRLFRQWLARPDGLVLVTGPTGSGKSTTLYSALSEINDRSRKIVTVEDPVELRLPHIVQIQTQAEIGLTFAAALRVILRHDPDIIMVGEIRDRETAEVAIQAALTGHLVLATLHTNDALSSVTRLVDMGVQPYLVAAALRAVMAQRLVRRLCEACADSELPSPILLERVRAAGLSDAGHWRRPKGCSECGKTGYKGRTGIYELVAIDETLQHAIAQAQPLSHITALADQRGRRSLHDDGLLKVSAGLTHYDEVLRGIGGLPYA
jgi:general secretion pathway protein E